MVKLGLIIYSLHAILRYGMSKETERIRLKSYNPAGQTAVVLLTFFASIIVLYIIIMKASGSLESGGIGPREVFGFITLALLGLGLPLTVFFAVLRTMILTDSLEVNYPERSMAVLEKNILTGRIREKRKVSIEGFSRFEAIRIRHDEEGIANHYHIFAVFSDREPVRICTFSKYHYVLRFMFSLQNRKNLDCTDLTEMDFETEREFFENLSDRT